MATRKHSSKRKTEPVDLNKRTKRHDKIDRVTDDMLGSIRTLRPEMRAEALAQLLLFTSHMAGIARPSRNARQLASRSLHHG